MTQEEWMKEAERLLEDYVGACTETAVFNATQRSGMTVRMAGPRRKALLAHLQQRPLTGREVSLLYDIVPPSAAEWFADYPGIANHDWRGGWDACRNRCRTLVDERLAASPSVQDRGEGAAGVNPSHGGQQ